MACFRPVQVEVRRKSVVAGGARVGQWQTVPCGKCVGCRATQARGWAVRILHERQVVEESGLSDGSLLSPSWFVTLTYDDKSLPESGALCSEDFRNFVRRLRRRVGRFGYFGCGEYGSYSKRPHYHAVLFGVDFLDRSIFRYAGSGPVWRSPSLEAAWDLGISEFGTVTEASASYVAGYVTKKLGDSVNVNFSTGEILPSPFTRTSQRPPLGERWIRRYWRDVYPRDYVVFGGAEVKPPRFYDKWMDKHQPEVMESVRAKRWEEMEEVSEYTLEAREAIQVSRNRLFAERGGV